MIKTMGTSPEPTSRDSHRVNKSSERALRRYLSNATLAKKLFMLREASLAGDVNWEGVQGRAARNRIAIYRA